MPTKKLPEPDKPWRDQPCLHPGHEPPRHMVYRSGTYEHTCPACGHRVVFTVSGIVCSA